MTPVLLNAAAPTAHDCLYHWKGVDGVLDGQNVPGLWACNGFSGHGFKLAPAVGSLVAQQITGLKTDAWETDVPFDFMGPGRAPLVLKQKTHFA